MNETPTADHMAVRRLAGLLKLAKSEPVSIRRLRSAVMGFLRDMDDVQGQYDIEHVEVGLKLARASCAIITSRYLGYFLPAVETVRVSMAAHADDCDAEFIAQARDAAGEPVDLTMAEKDVLLALIGDHMFAESIELIPEPGENFTLMAAELRKDFSEANEDMDVVLGLDAIAEALTNWAEHEAADRAASQGNGKAALDLVLGAISGQHQGPVSDDVLTKASQECVDRFCVDGDDEHLTFGLFVNGVLLARKIHQTAPEIAAIEYLVEVDEDGASRFLFQVRDDEGDLIADSDFDDLIEGLSQMLYPNLVFWEFLMRFEGGFRLEVKCAMGQLPSPLTWS